MLKLGDEYIDVSKVSYIGPIDEDFIKCGFSVVIDGAEIMIQINLTLDEVQAAYDLLVAKCRNNDFVADDHNV